MGMAMNDDWVFQRTTERRSCHAATIAELPSGDLLCAWYAGTRELDPDVGILTARRPVGADDWEPARVVVDSPDHSEGNPVLFAAPNGEVWLFYVTVYGEGWDFAKLKLRRSDDEGRTWGPEQVLSDELGWMPRNKPVLLSNGTTILPLYDERTWRSFFGLSADNGATWQFTTPLDSDPGNIQPTLVERADHSLFALMRTGGQGGALWQTTSGDAGLTWPAPTPASLPNPNSAADMARLPNGHLVLAFNNSPDRRTPLSVALSKDEGLTWPAVRNLEAGPGEYSYPAAIVDRQGLIHVVYTHQRLRIKHVWFDEAWVEGA